MSLLLAFPIFLMYEPSAALCLTYTPPHPVPVHPFPPLHPGLPFLYRPATPFCTALIPTRGLPFLVPYTSFSEMQSKNEQTRHKKRHADHPFEPQCERRRKQTKISLYRLTQTSCFRALSIPVFFLSTCRWSVPSSPSVGQGSRNHDVKQSKWSAVRFARDETK